MRIHRSVSACFYISALWVFLGGVTVHAQPALAKKIDDAIRKKNPAYDQQAATPADDAEFLRRVMLDLTGMIPSIEETRAFLKDTDKNRREALVDRLLASEAFARHMTNQFDLLYMDRRPGTQVKANEWQDFLRQSFEKNKAYDQLVREILSNDGADAKNRGPARFYLDRAVEPNLLTKDIGRLFLGMNLTCSQCHDHPIVDAYKQDFYFGIYAFLNRSYSFTDKKSKTSIVAEKAEGDVSFQSVFSPKVSKSTGPRLPGMKEIAEPKLEKGKEYAAPVPKGEAGKPTYSRRAQLADAIVSHPKFARSTANRVWSWLFGRGIYHPVEFDHEANPPSHPELLEMLAEEFRSSKHDLKALIRGIVLSQTYQRSSVAKTPSPDPAEFLASAVRPLSPEQFAWSLVQATGQFDGDVKGAAKKPAWTALAGKYNGGVQAVVALYANQPGEPAVSQDFETTLDQSLFLRNGSILDGWLAPRAGTLTSRLVAKMPDSNAVAEELYLSTLTRMPSAEERKDVADFLNRPGQDRTKAVQDLAWAILTSIEFRFNH